MTRRVALDVTVGHRDAGGTGVHVRELAAAMARIAPERVVPVHMPHPSHHSRWDTLRHDVWWTQVGVTQAARAADAALLHCPVPMGPLFGALPLVVTLHDVLALSHPAHFRTWHRTYTRSTLPPLARRARQMVAVSEATRAEVVSRLGVDAARVHVVPNGVHERFAPRPGAAAGDRARCDALGLPPRFVLTVGAREPRKNLVRLLAAVLQVADMPGGQDVCLVHAGPAGWRNDEITRAFAHAGQMSSPAGGPRVRVLGRVDDDTLAALYRAATVVAYPSLQEGFGLPVAEALASGAAVLTSCTGALGELAGDAAMTVDPTDTRAITEALHLLWTQPERRHALAARGPARAAAWRWDAVARATLAVYDAALA
jgi:glycosyltransferase involved in cell wall biosynthesis